MESITLATATTGPASNSTIDLDIDLDPISHLSPKSSALDTDTMSSSPDSQVQPQYLKMEDLQKAASPSPQNNFDPSSTQATPAPVIIQSKQAKKRKSWGQELPEPKTTLPPRKRAKTDDEKEQRRIERIKRNRAAAHNSRERKRQETETLAVLLARANAELDAYRRIHGPLPDSVVLPEVTVCSEFPESESADTPAPSLSASRESIDAGAGPGSPTDSVMNNLPKTMHIKQEPSDLPTTLPPSVFESLDSKPSSLPSLDHTQHSAAMLCDLQCRSSRNGNLTRASTTLDSTSRFSNFQLSWWTRLFAHLLMIQFQITYKQILLAIWTLSPSRMGRLIQASTTRMAIISRSTTSSKTTRSPSRSTRPLAQLNAATGPSLAVSQSSLVQDRQTREKAIGSRQPRHESALERRGADRSGNDADADPNDGVGVNQSGLEHV